VNGTHERALRIAHSPCPNDTFVFHAWTDGLVEGAPPLDVTFADIDVTNNWLTDPVQDVMKISYAALPYALHEGWQLVPAGGALGRGCGPLLLTRDTEFEADAEWLRGRTVAVPSNRSTAYLLFELWATPRVPAPGVTVVVMPFEQIMPAVAAGQVDAGLVIHEARFTYPTYGLSAMVDLGEWWESATGLPIPLGAIVARAGLDVDEITGWIQQSLDHAWADPAASADYVRRRAQEMDATVQQQHIALYVNEFTRALGDEGLDAVRTLLDRAAEHGLVPESTL
jgi:1,4-dihydroxy-6-naphthoate synthase